MNKTATHYRTPDADDLARSLAVLESCTQFVADEVHSWAARPMRTDDLSTIAESLRQVAEVIDTREPTTTDADLIRQHVADVEGSVSGIHGVESLLNVLFDALDDDEQLAPALWQLSDSLRKYRGEIDRATAGILAAASGASR